MKKIAFLLVAGLLGLSSICLGQTALPESRQSSAETRVYKLTAEDTRNLYDTHQDEWEQFLHTFVTGYADTAVTPELPRGNYLLVRAEGNRLVYTLHTVDDLQYDFINDRQLQLRLTNRAGESVTDARAQVGHRTMRYDPEKEVYTSGRIRRERLLEIEHEGVVHLVGVTPEGRFANPTPLLRRTRYFFQRQWYYLQHPSAKKQRRDESSGSVLVMDKPKYKPGETVRWKAHAATTKGKPIDQPLELWLDGYSRRDTLLATVKAARPGVYYGEFKADEKMRLKLNSTYNLTLKTKEKRTIQARGQFQYEEYELQGLRFTIASDRQSHRRNTPPTLTLKATDENGMAVMEGRYELTVRPHTPYEWENATGYVPDILWKKTIDIQSARAEEVVLPDSIFPEGVSFNYRVEGRFVSADNAVLTANANLHYDGKRSAILIDETESGIHISQQTGDKNDTTTAEITAYTAAGEEISRKRTELPANYRLPSHASYLTIRSERAERLYSLSEYQREPLTYDFYSRNDSIHAQVHNPGEYPFWYQLRRGKHVIEEGYATAFDYRGKQRGRQGYHLWLQYLFGGELRDLTDDIYTWEKNIHISVNTPELVYPGQKAQVEVCLTDHKGRPVRNADVTAYAMTTKFESDLPRMPYWGKANRDKYKPLNPREQTFGFNNLSGEMDWERWRREMGLDSIAYYQFLHPEPVYLYTDSAKGDMTQIAPYAVIDGELQPVYVVKAYGEPIYYQGTTHLPVYSFRIRGSHPDIELRLADRTVKLTKVELEMGKRHILSVDASQSDTAAGVAITLLPEEQKDKLNQEERDFLSKYLIGVENPYTNEARYILSADRLYYLNAPQETIPGPYYRSRIYAQNVLTGPFTELDSAIFYQGDSLVRKFNVEGGYDYSIQNNYIRLKSFPEDRIGEHLFYYQPQPDFNARLLLPEDVQHIRRNASIQAFKQSTRKIPVEHTFISNSTIPKNHTGKLDIAIKTAQDSSALLFIFITDGTHSFRQTYTPKNRRFEKLPAGEVTLTFVMDDFSYCQQKANIQSDGTAYLRFDSLPRQRDSIFSKWLCRHIEKEIFWEKETSQETISIDFAAGDGAQGRIFSAFDGLPLAGCTILVKGTTQGTVSDVDGYFSLPTGEEGDTLVFAFVGCKRQELPFVQGGNYQIYMEIEESSLQEIVTVGYSLVASTTLTGAAPANRPNSRAFLEEAAARANAKDAGVSTPDAGGQKPLLIVDGKPFAGSLGDLDESSIISLKRIAPEEGVELYGNQAAGGVLIITTGKKMEENTPGNSLRQNFNDAAFWQPTLLTDQKGKASFEAIYPDDVTSWDAYFLAFGPGKRTGATEVTVKSFKSLMARLSLPRFAIAGDSLNAIGRLNNYLGDTVTVERKIVTQEGTGEKKMSIATSHVDTIPLIAPTADSLQATYTLETANGYFDGERRTIPVYKPGCEESEGVFLLLDRDTTFTLRLDSLRGELTVHAEASPLELFLEEIEEVNLYPYLCNEQMASKLKVLLLKKQIYQWTKQPFKEEKKIEQLIEKLEQNRNSEGMWGWWNRSETTFWITRQVVEALRAAKKAGYSAYLPENQISNRILGYLRDTHTPAKETMKERRRTWADALEILHSLGAKVEYAKYIRTIDSLAPPTELGERLQWLQLKQAAGMAVDMDSVMKCSQKSLLGGLYWSEETKRPRLLPFRNNTQHTLAAYRILREMGGHEKELRAIRTYFFEVRGHRSWSNTYESSRILETILPDMMEMETSGPSETRLRVNSEEVDTFPFTRTYPSQEILTVSKDGGSPVFFTAYRTAWNPAPEKREGEFQVKSYFVSGQDTVERLEAGQQVNLEVEVEAIGEANYVMIEIPIPAGCTYATRNNYLPGCLHAEYGKEKVTLFCTQLAEGTHIFRIALLPRFTGRYHLNPARAELMYFPTIYGREGMKQVGIE